MKNKWQTTVILASTFLLVTTPMITSATQALTEDPILIENNAHVNNERYSDEGEKMEEANQQAVDDQNTQKVEIEPDLETEQNQILNRSRLLRNVGKESSSVKVLVQANIRLSQRIIACGYLPRITGGNSNLAGQMVSRIIIIQ